MRYRPQRKAGLVQAEAAVEGKLVELAKEMSRFGNRVPGVLLKREGLVANHSRIYRLCKKDNLALGRENRKRHTSGLTSMTSRLISAIIAVASSCGVSNCNDMEVAALRQPLSAISYLWPRLD